MTSIKYFFVATALIAVADVVQAKDIGVDEAVKLREAGTIKTVEQLNAAALAQHPGATIRESDLEQEAGRYVYEIDLIDAQGIEWDVELDATNAQILQNHRDD